MLKIEKLNFSYGDLKVLWDVDLEVREGEIVTVVGANGAGKSTLLKNISRLVKPGSGAISFNDGDLTKCEAHEVVELGVVQVPEGRKIFPQMSVIENLLMGAYLMKNRKDVAKALEGIYGHFSILEERRMQLAGSLSGGSVTLVPF